MGCDQDTTSDGLSLYRSQKGDVRPFARKRDVVLSDDAPQSSSRVHRTLSGSSIERAPWTSELNPYLITHLMTCRRSRFARRGGVAQPRPSIERPLPDESLSTDIQWFDPSSPHPRGSIAPQRSISKPNRWKPVKPLPPNAEQAIFVTNDFVDADETVLHLQI